MVGGGAHAMYGVPGDTEGRSLRENRKRLERHEYRQQRGWQGVRLRGNEKEESILVGWLSKVSLNACTFCHQQDEQSEYRDISIGCELSMLALHSAINITT